MARLLSQTLIRTSTSSSSPASPPLALSSRILSQRNRSNKSGKARLVEVDLESDSEVEVLGIRRLEDVIHSIIVKRSAPDWLPFIPGSSYWVPPRRRRHLSVVDMIGKLATPLTEDETMSSTTVRGWPSYAYFAEGSASAHAVSMDVEVELEVEVEEKADNNMDDVSQSEDEG